MNKIPRCYIQITSQVIEHIVKDANGTIIQTIEPDFTQWKCKNYAGNEIDIKNTITKRDREACYCGPITPLPENTSFCSVLYDGKACN